MVTNKPHSDALLWLWKRLGTVSRWCSLLKGNTAWELVLIRTLSFLPCFSLSICTLTLDSWLYTRLKHLSHVLTSQSGGRDQNVKRNTIMDTLYKNSISSFGTNIFSILLQSYPIFIIACHLPYFLFLMSCSSNRIWGFKHHLECGARERIEFESISWGVQGKINLHPPFLAAICEKAECLIPVVKLENEVNGNAPCCSSHIW